MAIHFVRFLDDLGVYASDHELRMREFSKSLRDSAYLMRGIKKRWISWRGSRSWQGDEAGQNRLTTPDQLDWTVAQHRNTRNPASRHQNSA